MSSLTFIDEMACIQRSAAQCHDQVIRRDLVLDIMQLQNGERVLEIGCGGGFYVYEVAKCVGSTGLVCAIDNSADQIATTKKHCNIMEWVNCQTGDTLSLPYDDATFDLAYGIQVFEYVEELDKALKELQRVLRPGGRCYILSTDWRTAVWHSQNPERMQQILSVWETHSKTYNLPAILGVKLHNEGLNPIRQTPMTFLNRSFNENTFSYWAAQVIRAFVKSKHNVRANEVDAWFNEFNLLEQQQAYFFCLTSVLTEAIKPLK